MDKLPVTENAAMSYNCKKAHLVEKEESYVQNSGLN